jgi:hypothetical protein
VTTENAADLRRRLRGVGLSDSAITAAWPRWWSDEAEGSASARAELRFGLARRLGLDPGSLLEDRKRPRFLWHGEARFKHLSGESDEERAGISSFGRAVASILLTAAPTATESLAGASARDLRREIRAAGAPFVDLRGLLTLSWAVSVPVVHLRIFPWQRKRMAAMTVNVGDRPAVLLGRDSTFPATIAFYLAHELGHIALGHVPTDRQIIDLGNDEPAPAEGDVEEQEADAFALELLTGDPRPVVLPTGTGQVHGRALAYAAVQSAVELEIDAGTLALCFGYSTGDWQTATAALREIYREASPVWEAVNRIALQQLELEELPSDADVFLGLVLGQTVE